MSLLLKWIWSLGVCFKEVPLYHVCVQSYNITINQVVTTFSHSCDNVVTTYLVSVINGDIISNLTVCVLYVYVHYTVCVYMYCVCVHVLYVCVHVLYIYCVCMYVCMYACIYLSLLDEPSISCLIQFNVPTCSLILLLIIILTEIVWVYL